MSRIQPRGLTYAMIRVRCDICFDAIFKGESYYSFLMKEDEVAVCQGCHMDMPTVSKALVQMSKEKNNGKTD